VIEIADSAEVDAAVPDVWAAIADPRRHAGWHPFVTAITGSHREGAARTCEVIVGGRRGRTEEHCVRCDEGHEIVWQVDNDTTGFSRMVSEWRAGFRLTAGPRSETTTVTAISSFRPANLLIRLTLPLVRRRFHRVQRAILAALKRHVESPHA
jgi:uncharacterized protein YndB with AHSA1/START domain